MNGTPDDLPEKGNPEDNADKEDGLPGSDDKGPTEMSGPLADLQEEWRRLLEKDPVAEYPSRPYTAIDNEQVPLDDPYFLYNPYFPANAPPIPGPASSVPESQDEVRSTSLDETTQDEARSTTDVQPQVFWGQSQDFIMVTGSQSDEWLGAIALTQPELAFVLWAVKRNIFLHEAEFQFHFEADVPIAPLVDRLCSMGLLERQDRNLRLTQQGSSIVERLETQLNELETITALRESVVRYRASLESISPKQAPHLWAVTQLNLGTALAQLANLQTENSQTLAKEAVTSLQRARQALGMTPTPSEWKRLQDGLALARKVLGSQYIEQATAPKPQRENHENEDHAAGM